MSFLDLNAPSLFSVLALPRRPTSVTVLLLGLDDHAMKHAKRQKCFDYAAIMVPEVRLYEHSGTHESPMQYFQLKTAISQAKGSPPVIELLTMEQDRTTGLLTARSETKIQGETPALREVIMTESTLYDFLHLANDLISFRPRFEPLEPSFETLLVRAAKGIQSGKATTASDYEGIAGVPKKRRPDIVFAVVLAFYERRDRRQRSNEVVKKSLGTVEHYEELGRLRRAIDHHLNERMSRSRREHMGDKNEMQNQMRKQQKEVQETRAQARKDHLAKTKDIEKEHIRIVAEIEALNGQLEAQSKEIEELKASVDEEEKESERWRSQIARHYLM